MIPDSQFTSADRIGQVKGVTDAVSSAFGAISVTAAFIGLVWVVVEAFFLPDGLPRLDAAAFATLASAVAVAAVLIVAFSSTAVGAAGLVFRGWRKQEFDHYVPPFRKETRVETAQFLTLFVATIIVLVAGTIWRDISPWLVIGIPAVATFLAVLLTAQLDPDRGPDASRDVIMISRSLLSCLVWFPTVLIFTGLTLGSANVGRTGIQLLDVAIYSVFLLAAAMTNYVAAVTKPGIGFVIGIAITTVAAVLNPQTILAAPFRALHLVDIAVHFPMPAAKDDRAALEALTKNCDPRIVVRLPDLSYEMFIRQRIGLDWTANCDPNGGTVTFSRTFVAGTMPVASPTPMPIPVHKT